MLPYIKTLKVLFILLCAVLAQQTAYCQDFGISLNSLGESEQDTLCVGDSLKLQLSLTYNGTSLNPGSGTLNYYVGTISEDTEPFYMGSISWDDQVIPEGGGQIAEQLVCIQVTNEWSSFGINEITVEFEANEEDENSDNDFSNLSLVVDCEYVDFESELDSLAPSQDTLCVGDMLHLNGRVRYNGTEPVTIDTLCLNYGIGDTVSVYKDTLFNRTFQPDEVVEFSRSINVLNPLFTTGSSNLIVIWPTINRTFIDTISEGDYSIDSTLVACQYVDFESALDPLAPDQDTLCVGDMLHLNAKVRYNGNEPITVDTLCLNYGIGDTVAVYKDTLFNRTFQPDEVVEFSRSINVLNPLFTTGSSNLIVIWPTINRTFIDTISEGDYSIDSTLVACQYVDFESALDPLAPDQDTLCVGDMLHLNAKVRYNGNEPITVDTLCLNYGIGDTVAVYKDTLFNRTFQPDEVVEFSRSINVLNPLFTTGSSNLIVIWPTTTRMFIDTTPENDFSIDSTLVVECYGDGVDFGLLWSDLSIHGDTMCNVVDTLSISFGAYYTGAEPNTTDTLIINYYIGNPVVDLPPAISQDTIIIENSMNVADTLYFNEEFVILDPLFTPHAINTIIVWLDSTTSDSNPDNNIISDSISIGCVPFLPLDLVSFKGNYTDEKVILTWQVNSWTEGSYFSVERAKDGINFESIGRLEAIADGQLNTYQYTDNNPYLTAGYYRLKIVDIDGVVKYSSTLVLKKEYRNSLQIESVYLNQNEQLNIIYTSPDHAPLIETIYDITGRLVHRKELSNVKVGSNEMQVDVKHLNSGVYILSLQNNQTIISTKFRR